MWSALIALPLVWLVLRAKRTDPYSRLSHVQTPFSTEVAGTGLITLKQNFIPRLKRRKWYIWLALGIIGLRIVLYSTSRREKPLKGSHQNIIDAIHSRRLNPARPYIITGNHYSDLYVRNMGTFFNALLDPRSAPSATIWRQRQQLALQTIAYQLEFLKQHGKPVTTIVPLGKTSWTGVNIYTPPSDALFSMLFTLKALTTPGEIEAIWPNKAAKTTFTLETSEAARQLLAAYSPTLTAAIKQYLTHTLDLYSGLVKPTLHLSSARDGVKRKSSFYDNVIAWATTRLARELHLPVSVPVHRDLADWRQKLIRTFWDPQAGIFHNDLSHPGQPAEFSADSLIVISTRFFNISQTRDRQFIRKIITYIQRQSLDQPFPLKYTVAGHRTKLHWAVRFFAPAYMGNSIWSHWGMEYIKTLTLLAKYSRGSLEVAKKHLKTYQTNIQKHGGYPELYAADGGFFKTFFLRSVLHTGWVVNYEQARMLAKLA